MQSWRNVWRKGVAPLLSDESLKALQQALVNDDPRLVQGATSLGAGIECGQDWPVEACCALGYCGWQGDGLETVAEVEEFFARMCLAIDGAMGEPQSCRWFLCWFDETEREDMRRELLIEVAQSLARRLQEEGGDPASEGDRTDAGSIIAA
jgi:hypothetical protein